MKSTVRAFLTPSKKIALIGAAGAAIFAASALTASAQTPAETTINVAMKVDNKAQRTAFHKLEKRFEKESPGVDLKFWFGDDADYKAKLEEIFAKPPEFHALYWQAGERLNHHVRLGNLAELTGAWKTRGWDKQFGAAVKDSVSFDGKAYGLPYSYYHWAVYYRKSLFAKHGITPPKTWDEFKAAGEKFKSLDIAPVAIGTKDQWTTGGWFDYLNLRINGLEFHRSLTLGEVPFTDERVKKVLTEWKGLIDGGFFLKGHEQKEWKASLSLMYHDRAAMYLIGNFVVSHLAENMVGDFDFFRFPVIDPAQPLYEEAPLDVFMVPKNTPSLENSERFLAFMADSATQSELNKEFGMIPPNNAASLSDDRYIQSGYKMLQDSAGISQYYDRDTPKPIADLAVPVFAGFMLNPDVDATAAKLEEIRKGHTSTRSAQ